VFENGYKTNDDRPILNLLSGIINRAVDERIGPMTPVLQHANLSRAAEIASTMPNGDPNILAFVKSDAFGSTLKKWPNYAKAVQNAQNDPRFADYLPEMLAMTWRLAQQETATPQVRPIPPTSTTHPEIISQASTVQAGRPDLTKEQRDELHNKSWSTIFPSKA